jgi:hypothetical protein
MTPNSFLPRERRHNPARDQAQLRRRYFFKLLERCRVSIEQGKGSEIKLLRAGEHTFRIGTITATTQPFPLFSSSSYLDASALLAMNGSTRLQRA